LYINITTVHIEHIYRRGTDRSINKKRIKIFYILCLFVDDGWEFVAFKLDELRLVPLATGNDIVFVLRDWDVGAFIIDNGYCGVIEEDAVDRSSASALLLLSLLLVLFGNCFS